MRIATTLLAGGLLLVGIGCNGGHDPKAHAAPDRVAAAREGKTKPEYQEIKQGGRIYVVGSKAAAERVQGGGKPAQYRTAFGYGPNRETVVFEENKDGTMADHLMGEWEAKHGQPRS